MKNSTNSEPAQSFLSNRYTAASCVIAAYFILSSFLYFLNPLRFTEEIKSGFFGFVLGFGDVADVLDEARHKIADWGLLIADLNIADGRLWGRGDRNHD